MYTYEWYHWITFFFIYCFIGWIFESVYVSLKKRRFVNRGFLRLPMLPLYGTGAVMMLWVSLPVKDHLLLVYLSGVIGATLLEYVTGYVMERLFKVRYWDYSQHKYNLHGYICPGSSIAWGFLTLLMTEVVHQFIERFVLSLPIALETGGLIVVGSLFAIDTFCSVKEAFSLARALETMTKMKTEAEALQVQMALLKAELSQRVDLLKEDHPVLSNAAQARLAEVKYQTRLIASELKHETSAALTARMESLSQHYETVSKMREGISKHMNFYRKSFLRGNPTATSKRFADALKELKESLERHRSQK